MDNKKGFNLFGKKELPNQSNDMANLNTTPQPEVNQLQNNEQNPFDLPAINSNFQEVQEQPMTENQAVAFEPSVNTTPEMPAVNNTDFNNFSQNEFEAQTTEPTRENQLATEASPVVQNEPAAAPIQETAPEQPVQASTPAPEPGTINTLNNLGAYDVDIKETAKKELNKKPFIIIAGVLLLALCLIGMTTGGDSKLFGKAPNDITIPGENEDDPSNKAEEPNENEGESGENNDDENEGGENESGDGEDIYFDPSERPDEDEQEEEETTPIGSGAVNGGSISDTVSKQEHTQIKIDSAFDTLVENPTPLVLPHNMDVEYEVRQDGNALNILLNGSVVSYIDMTPTDEEAIDGVAIYATGHISNNYLLIKVHKNYDFGDFYILDKNFQIAESGKYELESEPTITIDGIYYGKVNCNGQRSDKKIGPTVEVYKFDTKKGTKQYRYSIDYSNEFNKCS